VTDGCYSEGDSQGLFTPVSLGYPLSVFYKNSTLKNAPQGHDQTRVLPHFILNKMTIKTRHRVTTKPGFFLILFRCDPSSFWLTCSTTSRKKIQKLKNWKNLPNLFIPVARQLEANARASSPTRDHEGAPFQSVATFLGSYSRVPGHRNHRNDPASEFPVCA